MEILMLIGFAGVVVLLGYLSCVAGGSSKGSHMRGGRDEIDDRKRRLRR